MTLAKATLQGMKRAAQAVEIAHSGNVTDRIVALLDDLAAAVAERDALRAENKKLLEALQDVIDPISQMKRELRDRYELEGVMAVSLSRDPEYLRSIARAAIAAKETT